MSQETAEQPIVYIVGQQPFDYTPASAFGTLYFMGAKKLAPQAPNDSGDWNKATLAAIRNDLKEYRPGVDYVIPTGQPSMLLLVGMILAHIGGPHRVLGWDARCQRYLVYNVSL
jgi:hypothetical protein